MFCQDCKDKPNCKEICKSLSNHLEHNPDGYSNRHIRRIEIPYGNARDLEIIATRRAFELRYGKRYRKATKDEA